MEPISTQPPKGTYDWMPEEFRIRKHIFDTWRKVCQSYGYQEYLTPVIEYADLYRAKSGEDIGGPELMAFTDRGGRELALRPEMTPSVTRMVAEQYRSLPKPIRLFSIANFIRNEKPQRGRNREFWQLNYDLFGSDSIGSDAEIIMIAIDIMRALNAPKESFRVYLNHRSLIADVLSLAEVTAELHQAVVRIMDKWEKIDAKKRVTLLQATGISTHSIDTITTYMNTSSLEDVIQSFPSLKDSRGASELNHLLSLLRQRGYGDVLFVSPTVIRGFDYYNGMVFEVFDTHKDNNRALFGGGRYNGLAHIFGAENFPAVGCAPGDEPLRLFLESWDLLDMAKDMTQHYFVPQLPDVSEHDFQSLVTLLRKDAVYVTTSIMPMGLSDALSFAGKHKIPYVAILGTEELKKRIFLKKDMGTGKQTEHSL